MAYISIEFAANHFVPHFRSEKLCDLVFLVFFASVFYQKGFTYEISAENNFWENDITLLNASSSSVEAFCSETNLYKLYDNDSCDRPTDGSCKREQFCNENSNKMENISSRDNNLIETCPMGYPDGKTREKCLATRNDANLDVLLSLPVSAVGNITYKNIFCAVCNCKRTFSVWNVALACKHEGQNNVSVLFDDPISIVSNLEINKISRTFVSNLSKSVYHCQMFGYPPTSVNFYNECFNGSICQQLPTKMQDVSRDIVLLLHLRNGHLPRMFDPDYEFYENPNKFGQSDDDYEQSRMEDFQRKGTCHVNRILELVKDFSYIDNETIFVPERCNSFGVKEWSRTLSNNSIYFCGTTSTNSTNEDIFIVFKWICLTGSVFCLILLLTIIHTSEEAMFNTITNKSVVSLSYTLLASLLLDEVLLQTVPCTGYTAAASHYLFLSYHTWVVIVAQNFWRVIYWKPKPWTGLKARIRINTKWTYRIVGWIMPGLIVAVGIYFDFAPDSVIPCDLKPHYGKTSSCFIENKKALFYLCHLPFLILYGVMVVLFTHTFYGVYLTMKTAESIPKKQKQYFIFFLRYVLLAGSTVTLHAAFILTKQNVTQNMYLLFISSQGILVFIGYGFRKTTFKKTLKKLQDNVCIAWIGTGLRKCFGTNNKQEKDDCAVFGEYVAEKLRILSKDEFLKHQVEQNIRTYMMDGMQLYLHRKRGSVWFKQLQPIAELENEQPSTSF